ncbi:MAG: UDP-N-acetylmuramoyl-L-alanine--D-glutamate ligase [Candidatus Eisenbacteria bacterium]|nr:UDP-N-acetylmuramoyl-L-alanine--D-glutamate ligase [Candidatus Eisenbacteria bacterium]
MTDSTERGREESPPEGRDSRSPRSQRVLVVGLARSGLAAVDLLLRSGVSVVATDLRDASELGIDSPGLRARGVELELGSQRAEVLDGIDLVVLSPGVPLDSAIPSAARLRGTPIIGELELAFRHSRGRWLAVTGTNGKTTTTALLGELAKTTGSRLAVAGNIGLALSGEVESVPEDGLIVAEVSSFQLDTIESFRPHVGVLLNITADHLDRYDSFEAYARSKARVFENQGPGDYAVLNYDDDRVAALAGMLAATVIPVSARREVADGVFLRNGRIVSQVGGTEREIVQVDRLGLPGPHNLSNALAATAAAAAIGVAAEDAAKVLVSFTPLEHRLEPVAVVDGVRYVNDSKATNVDSVMFALRSFDAPIVLIAGGKDKDSDFRVLRAVVAEHVKRLVLIGEAAEKMERQLAGLVPTDRAASLRDAVLRAQEAASPGDVVLLSPACASFDMFKDFEDRGRKFKEEVAALARGPRGRASGSRDEKRGGAGGER